MQLPMRNSKDFDKSKDYLASSRPTAVNLFWALERMASRLEKEKK